MKVDELVWSSSWHVVALGWILPLPPPPRRVWAQWTHSYSVSLRWKLRSSAFSIWCTRWLNFVGRSAWTSLGQSWTVGLRPVLWTALSASLIQANSSWILCNRPRNPSQSSQKAFLIDLSTTFLEKGGSSKKEQLLMGWLKKWLWGIDWLPPFVTLGHLVIWEWTKTNFLVWGLRVIAGVQLRWGWRSRRDEWERNHTAHRSGGLTLTLLFLPEFL